MFAFILSVIALIVGYLVYGKFVEKVFGPNDANPTPAERLADGVDYVPMSLKKTFLIQFLNIAGTGPIFGAILGAMWGPMAFIWIVFGCIFAGAVHDYLIGMMSLRKDGDSVAELVGHNLGNGAKQLMRIFSVVLLVLVGVVFVTSPAGLLNKLMPQVSTLVFVCIIIVYYIIATVLPIDKLIGKIYPIFGVCLLIMAVGIGVGIVVQGYQLPEFAFRNFNPKGTPIFPTLCITIACGAISGFHATQSPMMARCLTSESQGRKVFYGAMITEGVVALVWAAAAMSFFGGVEGLATQGSNPAVVVNTISNTVLGKVGGALAILGVVACPITSGDTAFRSARLTIADALNYKQGPIMNRFIIAIPLFAIGIVLCNVNFNILWRYFSWSNQTLAAIALWAAATYLAKNKKFYWIALVPAVFMTVVCTSFIVISPIGFRNLLHALDDNSVLMTGNILGIALAIICLIGFFRMLKRQNSVEGTVELEEAE
ncbi:Peptide transporter CstA [Fusobacterium sp. DD29]|uniref:carbon starvation CstA family protein n=1 Tax=unclassified Fusobacterium TaxID=2648384 RepID=UPI001B8D3A73|nr:MULTISPECIES: carbon starvation protein A [unclassified Fusobacterium]MBR8700848.1 Peptide transporter CstA [Fusobacterium sp. DD45]MBR8710613.1 Peptide transporter CstA [Fusobacterium sp. DD28]MBR8748645.1 Peptide transporter CstA [Fusobacterium sp. DD29]MBR8751198.1 Peptide transporter CstA [Fusobacterium sp. DD26]MBR8760891.1 Peptide transporter CstA [Fusobacterium sp. DD25]